MAFNNRMQWLKSLCPLVDEYKKHGKTWDTLSGRIPYGATCLWCNEDTVEISIDNNFFCQGCYRFGDIFSLAMEFDNMSPKDFMKKKCHELNIVVPQEVIENEKSISAESYKKRLDMAKNLRESLSEKIDFDSVIYRLADLNGTREYLSNCETYYDFMDALREIIVANIYRLECKPEEDPWG